MNSVNDRGALPSASKMSQIFHCPASFRLNLSETPETSAAAEEGTMLHRVCELTLRRGNINPKEAQELAELKARLTEEQLNAASWACQKATEMSIAFTGDQIAKMGLEERLWAHSKLYSGKGDAIYLGKNADAVVVDFKFGRGDVERAESNLQLAALAVLVYDNFSTPEKFIQKIKVAIIQPRAMQADKRITEAVFDAEAIYDARSQINEACYEALNAEAPKQACGYWCKYCASAYRCKAANAEISRQMTLATSPAGNAIGVHNARKEFELCQAASKFIAARLAKIKEYIENNPDAAQMCGLQLKAGARRPKLGNANEIFAAVENVGITPDEFVGACDVGLTELQKLYHAKRKDKNEKQTQKASDSELRNLLEELRLLTYVQNVPSLAVVE